MTVQGAVIPANARETNAIATTVALVSFSMLFATLFMGYAAFRFTSPIWPPAGVERVPLFYPLLSTLMIALSSLTLEIFRVKKNFSWLLVTAIFGLCFVAGQAMLWSQMRELGYMAGMTIFSSIILAFTWIHVAHMALGLLGLLWMCFPSGRLPIRTESLSKFWHFLGIIWLVMLVVLFVF
jgi:cytochrome c oxidase subunit 3